MDIGLCFVRGGGRMLLLSNLGVCMMVGWKGWLYVLFGIRLFTVCSLNAVGWGGSEMHCTVEHPDLLVTVMRRPAPQ
jgi:hypothetical protein